MTGSIHLLYDGMIANAKRKGKQDQVYEYTVLQRQYYEKYTTEGPQLDEWKRREAELRKW